MTDPIEAEQVAICKKWGATYAPAPLDSTIGFATETQDLAPINGLRHRPAHGTNGWFIWGGEQLSSDPKFFQPLHTKHLLVRKPEVVRFLGLPPGYRFLIAENYADVWFDPSLLDI
jgi:hypothetical protein